MNFPRRPVEPKTAGNPRSELRARTRDKLPAKGLAERAGSHARNAKARVSQAVNAGRMSKTEEGRIDKKADTVIDGK